MGGEKGAGWTRDAVGLGGAVMSSMLGVQLLRRHDVVLRDGRTEVAKL